MVGVRDSVGVWVGVCGRTFSFITLLTEPFLFLKITGIS